MRHRPPVLPTPHAPVPDQARVTTSGLLSWGLAAAAIAAGVLAVQRGFDGASVVTAVAAALAAFISGLVHRWPVNPLYARDPGAPARAREHGRLAPARVVSATSVNDSEGTSHLVRFQVLVAPGDTAPYLTWTMDHVNVAVLPTRTTGSLVAVRVHPEQPAVVVITDDEPPGPAPQAPSGALTEHDGTPLAARGRPMSRAAAALAVVLALATGVGAMVLLLG